MSKLAEIYLSTKTELSLLKDKLYLFLEFLKFKAEKVNTIVKSILEISYNELLDENEVRIDVSIEEENEGYCLVFKIFTPQAFLYIDKNKNKFDKVDLVNSAIDSKKHMLISIQLTSSDFYPGIKILKHAEFILNQLSPDEMVRELEEENNKLRQRLIRVGKEREMLETKLETRSMFLAYLSHEIRIPMNGILGFADILSREENESKRIDFLNKIKTSGNDLLNLVNDILDFSKLEAGKLNVENVRFNLSKIMEEINEHFSVQAENKGLDFIIDMHLKRKTFFVGDPLRLKQVLINLINNAVKFTNEGYVKVSVESTEENEQFENLSFIVKDTGIGIRKEVIGKLFSPYIQADDKISRRFGGTGLGLFICKQLIELLGGVIEVKSEPGKGSEFSFVLPYKVDPNFNDEKAESNFYGLKAIIVDSYQIGNEAISETLTRIGFKSESVLFCQNAIELLKKNAENKQPVDLAIINYDMPFGLNGAQTAKLIKQDLLIGDTKIIIISAYNHDEELVDYTDYFDAFINKPVSQEALLKIVANIFNERITTDSNNNIYDLEKSEFDLVGLKVLLADDSTVNQELVSELLGSKGVNLTVVDDGKKAIETAVSGRFDLILMDINMPGISGIEASLEISRNNQNVPIIAITAHENIKNEQFATGIVDYIIKPFESEELCFKIMKWVSRRKDLKYKPVNEFAKSDYFSPNLNRLKSLGIDIDGGLKRVNGKTSVYESLLNNFRKSYFGLRDDFERLFKTGQIDEAKRLVHTVKGASGTLGASKLSILAKELETDLKNDQDHRISKRSFFNELESFLNNLSYLGEIEENKNIGIVSTKEIKKIVAVLEKANECLDYDVGQTISIIDSLVEESKSSHFYNEVSKIAAIAYSFQIEDIKSVINGFIKKYAS